MRVDLPRRPGHSLPNVLVHLLSGLALLFPACLDDGVEEAEFADVSDCVVLEEGDCAARGPEYMYPFMQDCRARRDPNGHPCITHFSGGGLGGLCCDCDGQAGGPECFGMPFDGPG